MHTPLVRKAILIFSLFFSSIAFSADTEIEIFFKEYIDKYNKKVLAKESWPITFDLYLEGNCEGNSIRLIKSLIDRQIINANAAQIIKIERLNDDGYKLPFLPKTSGYYYNFDESYLKHFHFYNQGSFPYGLIIANQCVMFLLGYHGWHDHFVILIDGKIYDIDTQSNGVPIETYFKDGYIEPKHPELLSQYKISIFPNLENYLEFATLTNTLESQGLHFEIKADNMQISLNDFLENLPQK